MRNHSIAVAQAFEALEEIKTMCEFHSNLDKIRSRAIEGLSGAGDLEVPFL